MSSKEVSQKQSQDVDQSSAWTTTKETVSSAAANIGGAFNFSGGLSANAGAYKKKTTTTSGGGQEMSKAEAAERYEELMEDEYAKRDGGA